MESVVVNGTMLGAAEPLIRLLGKSLKRLSRQCRTREIDSRDIQSFTNPGIPLESQSTFALPSFAVHSL